MTNDPWAAGAGEVTATVKSGKGPDSGWLVFKGPSVEHVKRQMCESFGADYESNKHFTLAELTLAFSQAFQAKQAVVEVLDGRIVDPESGVPAAYGAHPADVGDPEWDYLANVDWDAKPVPVRGVYNLILESPSVAHLNDVIWHQYYVTIESDPDLNLFFLKHRDEVAKEERKAAAAAAN